jgi:hypothetical protein
MTEPNIDVQRIVREVLARLGQAPDGDGAAGQADAGQASAVGQASSLASTSKDARAPGGTNNGDLVLACRVVTLADVGDRLAGVRRLVVPPGAVITPAVRDELQAKKVTLDFGTPEPVSGKPGAMRVAMIVLGSKYEPAPLAATLRAEAAHVAVQRFDCLIAATDRAAGEVRCPDTLALVVTTYPAAALCLANRHRGVRAVWGVDPARLAGDLEAVGANLLVLDPRGTGQFPLKQMAIRFCRRGPAACPESLVERLS